MSTNNHFISLTDDACILLDEYYKEFPEMREEEVLQHDGIDPLENPIEYFEDELLEPVHYDILKSVVKNGGVINAYFLFKWILQEFREMILSMSLNTV